MSGTTKRLPAGFEQLEPFVAQWAVQGTATRAQLRGSSTEADRAAFYDAAHDILPKALAYLDAKPLKDFDEKETALMNLILSLGHVALSIEIQGSEDAHHRKVRTHMRITRSAADRDV
jgi:hypothetical protein